MWVSIACWSWCFFEDDEYNYSILRVLFEEKWICFDTYVSWGTVCAFVPFFVRLPIIAAVFQSDNKDLNTKLLTEELKRPVIYFQFEKILWRKKNSMKDFGGTRILFSQGIQNNFAAAAVLILFELVWWLPVI